MKKALTVVAVLIVVLVLCTAQNGLAQKDPFSIGNWLAAKSGKDVYYDDDDYDEEGELFSQKEYRVGNFSVSHDYATGSTWFTEYPASGKGKMVQWEKGRTLGTYYRKYTYTIKNGEAKMKRKVDITKEEAEKEAWRILGHLGYSEQNGRAQEDLFKTGKQKAMNGKFDSPWWTMSSGRFAVSYNPELDAVAFEEYPKSKNGAGVMWIKHFGKNTYTKFTFTAENGKVKKQQQVSITKEEAEEGARRVLRNLGYLQY